MNAARSLAQFAAQSWLGDVLGGSSTGLAALDPVWARYAVPGAIVRPAPSGRPYSTSPDVELYERIENLGIIIIEGVLRARTGVLGPFVGVTGCNRIRVALFKALEDPMAEGVVLRVDSRGGELAGILDLADAIRAARAEKPIISVIDESATAGAYVLASAASCVSIPRTGYAGSVGVLVAHTSFAGALRSAGISVTPIFYGARKADGIEAFPLSPSARRRMQEEVNTVGAMLVETVARNRGSTARRIRDLDGANFLGADAIGAGLADVVSWPDEALEGFSEDVRRPRRRPVRERERGRAHAK